MNARHQRLNHQGAPRFEIRVKYVNGSNGLWGYCDDPSSDATDDEIRRAEASPGVVAARVINPKTCRPFKTPQELRDATFRDSVNAYDGL